MKNAIIIAAMLLTACAKAPIADHAPSLPTKKTGNNHIFLIVQGQSNADGRCTADRLVNPAWAYKGISALPLAARVAQSAYGFDATDIDTYFKTRFASDDHSIDNGQWQPYQIGVNSAFNGAQTTYQIGPEYAMAVRLRDHYGVPVHIIKVAFSSTGLCPWINETTPPGTWNPTATHPGNRYIAIEYYVKRAIRDFRTANSDAVCLLAGCVWWGGESDANANVTKAQYDAQFNRLLDYEIPALDSIFDNTAEQVPQWNLVRLSFRRNAKEALINDALFGIASSRAGFHYVDSWPYPRCQNLTTAQASPIAKGLPNSAGGNDNLHASHIAELAVGERCAQNVISNCPWLE